MKRQPIEVIQYVSWLLVLTFISFNTTVFAESVCGNSPEAVQLAELIRKHPEQLRTDIRCNFKLTQIAEHKAGLLSEHDVIMHHIGYLTPNQLLRKKGYALSSGYPILGNQVEAIAAGEKSAKETLQQLLNSQNHRRLLLGEAPFYQPQNEIGVAYVNQSHSSYDYYWVVYFADTKNRPKPKTEYLVNSEYKHIDPEEKSSIRERHRQSRARRPKMATEN
ncbi:CAP domain-containing protein [Marinicella gelatinilytica]|uniref:CAP domain-containing protein n=1 Tax=Marinicella gelatinilytica TaxID=2996017 RepID=UPI0022608F25|nr:CAP domain-containing protein [Marinicella gelatinilytica]MCX7544561.1 CAP domain-containing protein [Marinicella gelatinilytica]